MLKKIQVVMLPTNEKAQLVLTHRGRLENCYIAPPIYGVSNLNWKYQHLYFLSDEEIREGDWFIHNQKGIGLRVWQSTSSATPMDAKKIIATTDSSLKIEISTGNYGSVMFESLPQPSQSFLEVFVREYNKGNVIKEVMVEYEDKGHEDWIGDNENGEPFWIEDWQLKVNPKDNTITIKPLKESWSREEVIEIIHKYNQECEDLSYNETQKWVEQNL